jgi:hypothetical protein
VFPIQFEKISINKQKSLEILSISIILFTIFSLNISYGIRHYNSGYCPWEKVKYESAIWINENIPTYEKIGSFNTGIIQYYTTNFDVINLDGIVNIETYNATRNNNIEDYIIQNNISYIIDISEFFQDFHNNFVKLNYTVIQVFGIPNRTYSLLYLCKINYIQ